MIPGASSYGIQCACFLPNSLFPAPNPSTAPGEFQPCVSDSYVSQNASTVFLFWARLTKSHCETQSSFQLTQTLR